MANSQKSLASKPFQFNRNYFADPADDNPQQAAAAAAAPPDAVEAEAEDAANGNDFDNWELSDEQWIAIAAATP